MLKSGYSAANTEQKIKNTFFPAAGAGYDTIKGVKERKKTLQLREAFQKKTGYFMTTCQRVGRWQTQNMISFPKEIMTRGLVPESLVRKSEP